LRFVVALLSVSLLSATAAAQQPAQVPPAGSSDQGSSGNVLTTLASQFLEHDFVNFYLFANGVYDTQPLTGANGQNVNQGGWGFDGGGGVDAYRHFRDGFLSLSYRGDYRDYQSTFFPSGTSQSLAFQYQKTLSLDLLVQCGWRHLPLRWHLLRTFDHSNSEQHPGESVQHGD
jgi:hypothetical protein